MKNEQKKAVEKLTHFVIEMEITRAYLNGNPSKSEEVDSAITYQLRFVRELLDMISLLSGLAVTSLLTPEDEFNEYPFDHINMLEAFSVLTDFSSQILKNVNFQTKTGELKV